MKTPFGTTLPLTDAPYYSRVSSNTDNGKNYYLTAFNPGYALQASELNEIQEIFFTNLNLTQRMNYNWSNAGYNIPFWDGCIPLNPNSVRITSSSTSGSVATFTVTVENTWFYWTEKNSNMSFWIHNNLPTTSFSFTTTTGLGSTEYIGFQISNETIKCCQADICDNDQDSTLRDNSSGFSDTYYTCGASRKKATTDNVLILQSTASSTFFPLFKVTVDTATTSTFKYMDNQDITV
jgi:hypothetical protein